MSDLFLKYKKEREGIEFIEADGAFITYKFLNDFCYIEDIYCEPQLRKTGLAHDLSKQVEKIASDKGFKKLLGSVDVSRSNPERSLIACFNDGFKILNLQGSVIWLQKEIVNG